MTKNHLLRQVREQHGWSQAYVARAVGTDARTVGRWERGVSSPSFHFRTLLLQLFEMDAVALGLLAPISSPPADIAEPMNVQEPIYDPALPRLAIPLTQIRGRNDLANEILDRLETGTTCVLSGIPGVGKTTLAYLVSQHPRCKARFPDGLLWVGLGPNPQLHLALTHVARLLGVADSDLPHTSTLQDWGPLLHQAIGSRRLLIVLDDAWSVDTLLPFLVGSLSCAHLITTRLPTVAYALPHAEPIVVSELSVEESQALLFHVAPALATLPATALELVLQASGGLPLALTLLGHFLRREAVGGQSRRLRAALEQCRVPAQRLSLSLPDASSMTLFTSTGPEISVSLHNALTVSWNALPFEAQQALQTLSVLPAKPARFSEKAALAVIQTADTRVLDLLGDVGLLESAESASYTLHQTIADYGRLRLMNNEAWRHLVDFALSICDAGPREHAVLEAEHAVLLAALDATIAYEWHVEQLHLTRRLSSLWTMGGHAALAETYTKAALDVARLQKDRQQEGWMLQRLGVFAEMQGHLSDARSYFEEGLALARLLVEPDLFLQGALVNGLGVIAMRQGKLTVAMRMYQDALQVARHLQRPHEICSSLGNLADTTLKQGRFKATQQFLLEGLAVVPETNRSMQGILQAQLGDCYTLWQGHEEKALGAYEEALKLATEGEAVLRCIASVGMGDLQRRRGCWEKASTWLQQGYEVALETHLEEYVILAREHQASLSLDTGDVSQAETLIEEALNVANRSNYSYLHSVCLCTLGYVYLRQEHFKSAHKALEEAFQLLGGEQGVLQTEILFGQAQLAMAQGNWSEAFQLAAQSLELMTEMEYRTSQKVSVWLQEVSHELQKGSVVSHEQHESLPLCPHCDTQLRVRQRGKSRSGMQRYQCLSCNVYFTPGSTRVISVHEQQKREQVQILARQGMSLRAIARQVGVHHETVRRWLSEKHNIQSKR